jgi:hypothetical protein
MAGHSRSKNGVAEFTLGLAEGKTRGLAHSRSKNGVASLAYSRSKNGVAEFTLGLAEGKTRGLAYLPVIHVLLAEAQ